MEGGVQLSYSFELQFCYNTLQMALGEGLPRTGASFSDPPPPPPPPS